MKEVKLLFFVILFCCFLFHCSENNPTSPLNPGLPRLLSKSETDLISSDNKFGFKLFKAIIQEDRDKNVFISPLSVALALGMTYNGARGTTQEAMHATLELADLTLQEVNESYKSLIELLLNLDPKVTFGLANSIWYRHDLFVEQEFIDLNKTFFNAEVASLDFTSPGALNTINGWVEDNTNGRIKEIVKPIDLQIGLLFLINAIYFKGTWTYEFDPEDTYDGPFYLPDGSQKSCKMMPQEGNFGYFANDEFQAVDLPYGIGDFTMTILMSWSGTSIDDLISNLDQEVWEGWIAGLSEQELSLTMPKFKLEYEINLNEILKSLGMEIAFTAGADFSGMSPGLFIGKVLHKSFVEVDEEGTEAAAATVVRMDRAMGNSMTINHPFLFVIRETCSGTILFMGKIVDPVIE